MIQELRLGNLLQDGKSKALLRVTGLGKDLITKVVDQSLFPLSDGWFAEPIPLTIEWLMKFGFVYDDGAWINAIALYEGEECFNYNASYFEYDRLISIKYVHQLQNLYYILENEELD